MPPSPPARPERSAYAASLSLFVVKRALLMLSSALLVLLAGFGGASEAARRGVISVHIRLVTYPSEVRHVRSFSLRCNPTGGTLAVRRSRLPGHPSASEGDARSSSPNPAGWTIKHLQRRPFMPEVSVTATANGATRRFDGSPDCSWPGGQAVGVYFDAAQKDKTHLARSESLLRCDEDPVLFTVPTPLASVFACTHGLWTPRSEQLIRLAETTPALAGAAAVALVPA